MRLIATLFLLGLPLILTPVCGWGHIPGPILDSLHERAVGRAEGLKLMGDGDVPRSIHHMVVSPDGSVYVSSFVRSEVLRGEPKEDGSWTWWRVVNSFEGIDGPTGVSLDEDGILHVASFGTDQVLRYDPVDGLQTDITMSHDSLDCPEGISIYGGRVLVSSFLSDEILSFNVTDGSFIEVFGSGWHIDGPHSILHHPITSTVLVTSYHRNRIVALDIVTGKKIREFGGEEMKRPAGLVATPFEGEVLCSSHVTNEIVRYDSITGDMKGYFAQGYGLWAPTGLAVGPDMTVFVATFADGVRRYSMWR